MNWLNKYQEWNQFSHLNQSLKSELAQISDEKELEDRFSRYLEFGTGGMRGELGAGINRINSYTVRRVTQGLANYLIESIPDASLKGVAISYDSRHFSREFAEETACVLAQNGIKSFLSDTLRPTPLLSFMVREFKAAAGVMITASHNPAAYNGYKIYGEDGGQITIETANQISTHLESIENELTIRSGNLEAFVKNNVIKFFGDEVDELYLSRVANVIQNSEMIEDSNDPFKIIYTPLHGAGLKLVGSALKRNEFTNLTIVEDQAVMDGNFPTVRYPNPEEKESFKLAIELGKVEKATLIMATDPDSDRLGVAVLNDQNEYQILNGNQLGVLLLEYLLTQKSAQELKNAAVVKTIVTSDLGEKIAQKFNVKVFNTLTGFKYIGEKIAEFEEQKNYTFLFGYEESLGYLIDPFVRDKDAIQAALLTAEVALYHSQQGKTLLEALDDIYKEIGFYVERLENKIFKGIEAEKDMLEKINVWRNNPPASIAGLAIVRLDDYLSKESKNFITHTIDAINLPESNVLKFYLEDGSWFCIRPSGTEQKCKLYFSVHSEKQNIAEKKMDILMEEVYNLFG